VKTIVKNVIKLETKRHDFDNDFAYIEIWRNAALTDCYFAEKQFLWPDGSLKRGNSIGLIVYITLMKRERFKR